MIVDDEPLIVFALSKALRHDSRQIVTSLSGSDAISELSGEPFDLCILDIYLPDITGLEIMKRIKETCPETKIIIMTASNLSDEQREGIKKNAMHFISKPFKIEEVKAMIKHALDETDELSEDFIAYAERGMKEKRVSARIHFEREFSYAYEIPGPQGSRRINKSCIAVDTSVCGIGIWTDELLKPGTVIQIKSASEQKKGLVVWSKMTDDKITYRAGIKFI
jgi:CheY-like chemotaxis protein